MNDALRRHVTSVGFQLSLTRNQIATFIWLDLARSGAFGVEFRSGDSRFVMNVDGLIRRGLVLHHWPPVGWEGTYEEFERTGNHGGFPLTAFYTITTAGNAVLHLLREAGIYDETAVEVGKREARTS